MLFQKTRDILPQTAERRGTHMIIDVRPVEEPVNLISVEEDAFARVVDMKPERLKDCVYMRPQLWPGIHFWTYWSITLPWSSHTAES